MGRKLTRFQQESEKLTTRAQELGPELATLQTSLHEKQRLIKDLLIQQELEVERSTDFDSDITKFKKEEKQIQEQIQDITERLSALEEARARKLETLRDDAKSEIDSDSDKLLQEYVAKMYDLKNARGVIIKLLLEMHETREKARRLTDGFKNLSKQVDSKYVNMENPIPLYNVRALQDNSAGDHAAVLPLQSEMQWAIDGKAPSWFDYYLLTGEILSPAEIAAKEAQKK